MSTEENKAVVTKLMAKFCMNDLDGIMSLLDDELQWHVVGKPDLLPFAGTMDKPAFRKIVASLLIPMKHGLHMHIKGMVAEGDRVFTEVESFGEMPDGRLYNNEYSFLFVVENGRIKSAREQYDTLYAKTFFFREQ